MTFEVLVMSQLPHIKLVLELTARLSKWECKEIRKESDKMLYKLEELKLRMTIDKLQKRLAFYKKNKCSSQGESSSKKVKSGSSSLIIDVDKYEVIYPDEGELLLDIPSCEDQDLLLGGPTKLENEVSLSCPTQDEDYEVSSGVASFFSLKSMSLTKT